MTRVELHDAAKPILDALEDHSNGIRRISARDAEQLLDKLDNLIARIMVEELTDR